VLRLAAASGVVLVTGCSGENESPTPDSPTASASGGATVAEPTTKDELLLERVQAILVALLAETRAAARGRPGRQLARTLEAIDTRLSARLAALGADDAASRRTRTGDPSTFQRRLAATMVTAQRQADRIAGKAESGDLARLVASTGAGLAQDAAVLTTGDTVRSLNAARAGLTESIGRDLEEESVLDAVQLVLAGEHAAVYAYGVMGGRSPVAEAGLATRNFVVHRARRDALTAALRAVGAEPVAAEPGYDLPVDVVAAVRTRRVGQQVEDRCSVLYATLVAAAPVSTKTRQQAVTALADAGLRLLAWGGAAAALPGVQLP
jgi:hypothetical protein